jgi:hypothetical protein
VTVDAAAAIPAADAIPLPAPAGLLSAVLVAAFAVHALPMMAALGGGFWAWRAQRLSGRPAFGVMARRLSHALPYWMAAAVTTGVAALLFLQVTHGPLFYAASTVAAWPWLAVVPLLLLGYGGYYLRDRLVARDPARGQGVGLAAFLCLAAVSLLYVAVMTSTLHPERFLEDHLAHPGGLFLPVTATTIPRWLHVLTGALAASGAWVSWLAGRAVARGEEGAREVLDWASAGLTLSLLAALLSGTWFLFVIPLSAGRALVGGDRLATGALLLSVALTLSATRLAWRARRREDPRRALGAVAGHVVAIALLMAVLRDALRRSTLAGAYDSAAAPAAPQWGVMVLFAALLAAGLATVGWMAWAVARGRGDGA